MSDVHLRYSFPPPEPIKNLKSLFCRPLISSCNPSLRHSGCAKKVAKTDCADTVWRKGMKTKEEEGDKEAHRLFIRPACRSTL